MKRFSWILIVSMILSVFVCLVPSTAAARAALQPVKAARHHRATKHHRHKAAKHQQARHRRAV